MTPPYLRPISDKAFTKYNDRNDQDIVFACLIQESDWLYDLQVKIGDTSITAALIGKSFTLVRYGHLVQWRDDTGRFI